MRFRSPLLVNNEHFVQLHALLVWNGDGGDGSYRLLCALLLPVPVTRNRLAAALYVLILYFLVFAFGIVSIPHKKAPQGAFD